MKQKVLIVDDDSDTRAQMKRALSKEYEVAVAEDRKSALTQFNTEHPAVTLLDLGLPPSPHDTKEGMATLAGLLEQDRSAKVIIISGQGEKDNALWAVGAGAYDFHTKPVDMSELRLLLQRCVYVSSLEREFQELKQNEKVRNFEGILGSSPVMQEVFGTIRKVASFDAPVLILGESGTGKEMVANAIHRQSGRKAKPFVALNCSAIPENLIESELFGHEKGSFTGAHTQREGLLETANGGTLFLDEIGDLPASAQVKLLRFLQERRIQRVGGREELEIDTRILAATNADLENSIQEGTFREDLYFRLAVVLCRLPALRERADDIMLLANDFLRNFAKPNGKADLAFDTRAERAIRSYKWPGNVRELQNRVQRAVIMADGKRIAASDLELSDLDTIGGATTLKEAREQFEREMVERAIERHGGNISAAAAELKVSRSTIYELIGKLNIGRNKA